jgi:hypothetical protein
VRHVCIVQWEGSAEQLGALRMSLGLEKADDFWGPVGSATMQMLPKPKVNMNSQISITFSDCLLRTSPLTPNTPPPPPPL